MQGLTNFKVKLLGVRDVLLEFDSREDMECTLLEAASSFDECFEWFKLCVDLTVEKSFLAWVRVWKVSLGAWNTRFFSIIGNSLGNFICIDGITSRKERLDFARLLIDTTNPIFEQQFMDITLMER